MAFCLTAAVACFVPSVSMDPRNKDGLIIDEDDDSLCAMVTRALGTPVVKVKDSLHLNTDDTTVFACLPKDGTDDHEWRIASSSKFHDVFICYL
jgi:hypothetical protein